MVCCGCVVVKLLTATPYTKLPRFTCRFEKAAKSVLLAKFPTNIGSDLSDKGLARGIVLIKLGVFEFDLTLFPFERVLRHAAARAD